MESRRALISGILLSVAGAASAQELIPDESFRYRWMTIDALFVRLRKARLERTISLSEYTWTVRLLRDEELVIFREAARHTFSSEAEDAVWHRGKLKFPSVLEAEVRLLDSGNDPAYPRQ